MCAVEFKSWYFSERLQQKWHRGTQLRGLETSISNLFYLWLKTGESDLFSFSVSESILYLVFKW